MGLFKYPAETNRVRLNRALTDNRRIFVLARIACTKKGRPEKTLAFLDGAAVTQLLQKAIWSYRGLGMLSPSVNSTVTCNVTKYAQGFSLDTVNPEGVAVPK